MNIAEKFVALNLRRILRIIFRMPDKFETTSDNCDYFNQEASNLIRDGLLSNEPMAVSRFGYSELRTLLTYLHILEKAPSFKKILSFATGEKVEPWWSENTIKIITHNAGLFPKDLENIEKFCKLVLEDIHNIDVLGSWLGGEARIKPLMPKTKFIRFHDFYHFLHKDPWTSALESKSVLVVHPFENSIRQQFTRREKIFAGVHTLPPFKLITYKAIQSIAGNRPTSFKTWFDALEKMKSDISSIDFDVAILGCGAYGMPLAVSIKRDMKRKAIHLGGNTQILFGITGGRWENDPTFNHLFNKYWAKPLPEETPLGHETIDNNCYW